MEGKTFGISGERMFKAGTASVKSWGWNLINSRSSKACEVGVKWSREERLAVTLKRWPVALGFILWWETV